MEKEGNNRQMTINPKYLLIVFGFIIISVIGFMAISSAGGKVASLSTSKETTKATNDGFLGEKGESVGAIDGKILIDEKGVADGNIHSFNYFSDKESKTIYFFIVKASDGTYRVAANACEVCFGSMKGFKQVGDLIRCENCRVTYSKDKIALEKGGCNPGPINKNALVENGKLIIDVSDVEAVSYLF